MCEECERIDDELTEMAECLEECVGLMRSSAESPVEQRAVERAERALAAHRAHKEIEREAAEHPVIDAVLFRCQCCGQVVLRHPAASDRLCLQCEGLVS